MRLTNLEGALDFHDNYESKVKEASRYVIMKGLAPKRLEPVFGLQLGSGIGYVADLVKDARVLPYHEIPNFSATCVSGHEGKLVIGTIEDVLVMCFKGRKHYYEVADEPFNNGILKAVFPVHMLAELGVKNYFSTNAAGGLNLDYSVGDLMLIKSHINMIPNPLLGKVLDFNRVDNGKPVERFEPMHEAYDPELRKLFLTAAKDHKGKVHEGVLLGATGPTYETEAESLFFRKGIGADAVGMSVTPEVIVARNRGMKSVGFSCISDMIASDGTNCTNHEEVQAALNSAEVKDRIKDIITNFFRLYKKKFG
jgi:purine-nucleoside phosphorylase